MNLMSDFDSICVTDLVEDFLIRRAIEDEDRDNSHFHPSEFHGCKRLMVYKYYAYTGIIKLMPNAIKPSAILQRIFGNGHHIHYRWTDYLVDRRCGESMLMGMWRCKNAYAHEHLWKVDPKKNKDECKPKIYGIDKKLGQLKPQNPCEKCGCPDFKHDEIGFYDEETMMGGHIDGLLLWTTGDYIILDYKSARKRVWDSVYDKPKPEHYTQMQSYLYLSGLKYGKFLYECKDDQEIKEINVRRNDEYIDSIVSDAKLLKQIVTTTKSNGKRVLPPKSTSLNPERDAKIGREVKVFERTESGRLPYACNRCPFRSHCWKKK